MELEESGRASCARRTTAALRNVVAELDTRERCEGLALIAEATGWSANPATVYQNIVDVVGKVLKTKDDPIRMPINRHPLVIQKDANLGTMVKGLYRWK